MPTLHVIPEVSLMSWETGHGETNFLVGWGKLAGQLNICIPQAAPEKQKGKKLKDELVAV